MRIVWDEPKRLLNLDKHGYDFADLNLDFFADAAFIPGRAGRSVAIGEFSGKAISVVFRRLGHEGLSIISMRAASSKERSI